MPDLYSVLLQKPNFDKVTRQGVVTLSTQSYSVKLGSRVFTPSMMKTLITFCDHPSTNQYLQSAYDSSGNLGDGFCAFHLGHSELLCWNLQVLFNKELPNQGLRKQLETSPHPHQVKNLCDHKSLCREQIYKNPGYYN